MALVRQHLAAAADTLFDTLPGYAAGAICTWGHRWALSAFTHASQASTTRDLLTFGKVSDSSTECRATRHWAASSARHCVHASK